MTEMEIERIMWSWPRVNAAARTDWAKGFAASIARQARRRNWQPTPKQAALMRRMVDELFTHGTEEGDFAVIEQDL